MSFTPSGKPSRTGATCRAIADRLARIDFPKPAIFPRIAHLAALATFVGVPVRAFFAGDDLGAALVARPALIHALRDPQVERRALRASGLSPRTLRAIAAIIERAREIEGLQDGDAAPEDQVGAGAAAERADPAGSDA